MTGGHAALPVRATAMNIATVSATFTNWPSRTRPNTKPAPPPGRSAVRVMYRFAMQPIEPPASADAPWRAPHKP